MSVTQSFTRSQKIKELLEASELPIRTWSMKRHGRIADEIEASLQNEDDDDSSYQPSTEESDSDNSNSLPDHAEIAPSRAESTSSSKSRKRAGLGKRKPASDKSQAAAISQSISSADVTSQPSPKRPKQSDAADQQLEAQPERSSTMSPIGKQTPKATASKTGKRQHHAKRPCPVCGKDEGNLKCHLKSHAKKGLIEENQVDKLLAVATRGPGRASHDKTKKGLKLKWCPVEDCSTVTHYLRSHLTHFHHMKPGELFNTHLKVARHYQGSAEVTAIQEMIRSMSSQVKKPVATSTTTNTSEFTTNPSASSPSTSIADLPTSDPSCKNES